MRAETIYVEFRLDLETLGLHCEGDDKMVELWRALDEHPDITVYRSIETHTTQFPDFYPYKRVKQFDTGVQIHIVLATQRKEEETLADATARLTRIDGYLKKRDFAIRFPYRPVSPIEEFGLQ